MNDKDLKNLLDLDPLAEAERSTGVSYKDDAGTMALGMLMQFDRVGRLHNALEAADDTTLSNDLDRYLRIAQSEGFKIVLQLPFKAPWHGSNVDEQLYVLFHERDGILLVFDTFMGERVNGGHFYYSWRPNDGVDTWRVTSSGAFRNGIWAGYHDCREALRFHLRQLRQNGQFVTPWVERPFLWLLHYADTKDSDGKSLQHNGYDYKAINAERIAMLPEYVQAAITPGMVVSKEEKAS